MIEKADENPYLAARREWNERYGDYIQAAHTWKVTALLALAIALIGVGGAVYIGSKSRFIPYVIEVDPSGKLLSAGIPDARLPDARLIRSAISEWILAHRSVVSDQVVQGQYLDKVYAYLLLGSAGKQFIDDWYGHGNNPYERNLSSTVTVEVESVIDQSRESFQVDWKETSFASSGEKIGSERFRGLFTILFKDVDSSIISKNPMGIFFDKIGIQKIGAINE